MVREAPAASQSLRTLETGGREVVWSEQREDLKLQESKCK